MDILSILTLVTNLVPVAKALTAALGQAQGSKTAEAIDMVAKLMPVATQLMDTINAIKGQTEATHPEVWEKVREPYAAASSEFDRLRAMARTQA